MAEAGRRPDREGGPSASGLCALRPAWVIGPGDDLDYRPQRAAVERPFTLFVNGIELVTIVASPADLEELAVGYLANEGLIREAGEVTVRHIGRESGQIWLDAPGRTIAPVELGHRWLTACCGRTRPTVYFANDADIGPVQGGLTLDAGHIRSLMAELEDRPPELRRTGGLHWAGLGDSRGLWVCRADVGRHNALDKVAGWCLLSGRSPAGGVVVFSGRISSEVVLKTARMGAAWILSNAAPTSLGLELADTLNLTVAGFVREGRATVYTHPERLAGFDRPHAAAGPGGAGSVCWQ